MDTIPQPTIKSLLLSCFFSIILAIIILLIAVLPAEYNIDPTGLGKAMGLTVLSQTNNNTAKPSVISCPDITVDANKSEEQSPQASQWKDSVMITVPAFKGLEYKFHIVKGENLEFVWNTDGAALYFDFHGEPAGDKTGYFKSFKESTQNQSSGTLTAPFTGSHGWYWKNNSNKAVIINLQTRGNYKIIGFP